HVTAKAHQEKLRFDRALLSIQLEMHAPALSAQIDRLKLHRQPELRAGFARRLLQLAGNCTHSPHWHFPFASFVADEVVKKTAVLHERRIMGVSENADLRIGENEATHEIIFQTALDTASERFFHQAPPGLTRKLVCLKPAPE